LNPENFVERYLRGIAGWWSLGGGSAGGRDTEGAEAGTKWKRMRLIGREL